MGKYSQWLYHREIDQQLRERLEYIEQELHSLQEQATLLGDAASSTDNSILQAIAMQQSAEALLEEASSPPTPPLTNGTKQPSMSVSPALFAWSSLPNFDSRKGIPSDEQQQEGIQQTPIPHPEIHRPSPNLASLIEAEDQTQPQLQIPAWLRKAQVTNQTTNRPSTGPDERTNTSIQRWLERWGKLVPDPSLEHQTPQEGSEK